MRLNYEITNHPLIKKEMSQGVIKAEEKILNINKARNLIKKKIGYSNINIKYNFEVELSNTFYKEYDLIILTTYENNNFLKNQFGIKTEKYFHQFVEKIIIKAPDSFKNFSCVVLDGDFVCIDPFMDKHIIGHVKKSEIKNMNTNDKLELNIKETKNLNNYFVNAKKISKFAEIKKDLNKYFNDFKDAKYLSSFFVVRCTKKNKNDERTTTIDFNDKIISVHSGKWINCFEAAQNICKTI